MRVLRSWQELCMPSAQELETDRLRTTIARMNGGVTEDRLLKAVLGYSRYPYVVNKQRVREGPREAWYADIKTIFGTSIKVDRGVRLAEQEEQYDGLFTAGEDAGLSDLGKMALKCAGLRWHVFPCWEGRKEPACVNGLLDATTDR